MSEKTTTARRRGGFRRVLGLLALLALAYVLVARPWRHAQPSAPAAVPGVEGALPAPPSRRHWLRQFNKYILNPLTRTFAGRRGSPYALIYHQGRHSGRIYTTPVVAHRLGDSFVSPLPYGTDVDWLRNVLAAGKCHIKWQGQVYDACAPEVVDQAAGLPAFVPPQQRMYRRLGITHYLKLTEAPAPAEVAVPEVAAAPAEVAVPAPIEATPAPAEALVVEGPAPVVAEAPAPGAV